MPNGSDARLRFSRGGRFVSPVEQRDRFDRTCRASPVLFVALCAWGAACLANRVGPSAALAQSYSSPQEYRADVNDNLREALKERGMTTLPKPVRGVRFSGPTAAATPGPHWFLTQWVWWND